MSFLFYSVLHAKIIYEFDGHFYNYWMPMFHKVYAVLMLYIVFITFITAVWGGINADKKDKKMWLGFSIGVFIEGIINFLSYHYVDPLTNRVLEVGFYYVDYRQHLHSIAKEIIIIFFISLFIVIIGFPFFLSGVIIILHSQLSPCINSFTVCNDHASSLRYKLFLNSCYEDSMSHNVQA
jgi:hypothetical protein